MSREKRTNSNFIKREKEIQKKEFNRINQAKYNMLGAWLFTIPMIVWVLIEQVLGIVWPSETIFDIGMIVLAVPPLFIFGRETFTTAFKAVIQGNVNMDLLIVIGSGIAYLTGLATFFTEIGNYTDVAATIIAFHLTGKYFEEKSKGRISRDIEELLELRVKTAALIENHQVREISVEELEPGDRILVRAAETIPADGKIIKGKTKVDESMLNGKTSPVQKSVDDEVIGATVNQQGIIEIKVTRVGKNSCLFQFINMIEEAEKTRIPIQKDAEKITAVLIPLVLIIAVFTFLIWLLFPAILHSIGNWAHSYLPWVNPQISGLSLGSFSAIAVLVVACPCALGMATPTALLVGVGIGEENGILIQNGKSIETMQDVDIIAFDMTGDITGGQLQKTEFKK